jgi:hypothetical protein
MSLSRSAMVMLIDYFPGNTQVGNVRFGNGVWGGIKPNLCYVIVINGSALIALYSNCLRWDSCCRRGVSAEGICAIIRRANKQRGDSWRRGGLTSPHQKGTYLT